MRTVFFVVFVTTFTGLAPLAIWGQVPEEVGRKLDALNKKLETKELVTVQAFPTAMKYWREYLEDERTWLALIRASFARENLSRLAIRKFPESRAIAEERLKAIVPAEAIDFLEDLAKKPGWEEWVSQRRLFIDAGGHPDTDWNQVESHCMLIQHLIARQRIDLARQFHAKAIARWPASEELLALQATLLARGGEFDKAFEQYDSLKKHPFVFGSVIPIADAFLAAGKYEQGLKLLDKYGHLRRGLPTNWVDELTSLAHLRLGHLEKSAEVLDANRRPRVEIWPVMLKIQIERSRKDEEKAWQIAQPWLDDLQKRNGVIANPPNCLLNEFVEVLGWAQGKSDTYRKFALEMETTWTSFKPKASGESAGGAVTLGSKQLIRAAEDFLKQQTDPAKIEEANLQLALRLTEARRYIEAAKVLAAPAGEKPAKEHILRTALSLTAVRWLKNVRDAEIDAAFERDPGAFFAMRDAVLKPAPTSPPEAIPLYWDVQPRIVQSHGRVGVAILALASPIQYPLPFTLIAAGGNEADAIFLINCLQHHVGMHVVNKRAPSAADVAAWDRLHSSLEKLTKASCPENDPEKRLAFWRDWWNSNSKRIIAAEMAYLDSLDAGKAMPAEIVQTTPQDELDSPDVARLHVLRISAERDTRGDRGIGEMLGLLRAKPLQSEYWAGIAFLLDRESDLMADLCIRRAIELKPDDEAYFRQRAEMADQGFALELYEDLAKRMKDREAARALQIVIGLGSTPQASEFVPSQPVYLDLIRAQRFDDLGFLLDRARKNQPKQMHQVENLAALALAAKGKLEEAADHFVKSGCELPKEINDQPWSAREYLLVDYLAATGRWDLAMKCIDAGYRDANGRVPTPLGTMRMIEALALANLSKKDDVLKLLPFADEKNLAARFVEFEVLEIIGEKVLARDLAKKLVEPLQPKPQGGIRPNRPSEVGRGSSEAIRSACNSALKKIVDYYPEKQAVIAEHWSASHIQPGDRLRSDQPPTVDHPEPAFNTIEHWEARIDQKTRPMQLGEWMQYWRVLSRNHYFAKAAQSFVRAQSELNWSNPRETKLNAAQHWSDAIRKHELELEFAKNPMAAVELHVNLWRYRPELEMKGRNIDHEVPTIDTLRKQFAAHPRLGAILISSFFEPRTYAHPTRKDLIDLLTELSDERDMPIVVNQLVRSKEKGSPGALTAAEAEAAHEAYQKSLSAALAKWCGVRPIPGASIDEELGFWNDWWEKESPRILEKYTPK